MNTVVDSSVIAKWYLIDEEQIEEALKLRQLHIENKATISAPEFLLLEIGNIFVTRKLEQKDFDENIDGLLDVQIKFTSPDSSILKNTFRYARLFHLSFYDATYIALAKSLKCDFITADKKLVKATKTLKFVKLLSKSNN